jgi:hypothetical protein
MLKKMLLATLLMTMATVHAQSPSASGSRTVSPPAAGSRPTLTPEQQAQIATQSAELAKDSLKVATAIDQGQMGAMWDKASSVAKLFKRHDFIQQIVSDRSKLGAPSSRRQVAITFAESKGGGVPAGLYITIIYATQFARKDKPVRELISYHLDSDNVWRMSGYSVR